MELREQALLQKWGVREFKEELRFLPAAKLKALFHHEYGGRLHLQKMLYNLVWQAYTRIKRGKRKPIEGNLRTFWYCDVKPPLSFLGLMDAKPSMLTSLLPESQSAGIELSPMQEMRSVLALREVTSDVSAGFAARGTSSQYLYDTMTDIFYDFVSNGIFHFRDLGFQDDYAPYRFMGKKRPDVIVLAEKFGFAMFTKEVSQMFGCTGICLGGEPKLLSSEFFIKELSKRVSLSRSFTLIACVDYDPFGSIIAREFQRQLSLFGMKKTRLEMLITKKLFTKKELKMYPYKLPIRNKRMKTIVANWMKETGGVKGKPLGIECDVAPKERLRDRIIVLVKAQF